MSDIFNHLFYINLTLSFNGSMFAFKSASIQSETTLSQVFLFQFIYITIQNKWSVIVTLIPDSVIAGISQHLKKKWSITQTLKCNLILKYEIVHFVVLWENTSMAYGEVRYKKQTNAVVKKKSTTIHFPNAWKKKNIHNSVCKFAKT